MAASISNSLKQIQEIAYYIKEENVRGKERIPTSENLIKKFANQFERPPEEISKFIEQLIETHTIFSFNVVSEDPSLFVQAVNGYVYAEQNLVTDLKHNCEIKLSNMYETMFYKKKPGSQICRELYPRINEYNNTDIGKTIYEVYHLTEFQKVIQANAFEYTDTWRKEKLLKLFRTEVEATNPQNALDIMNKMETLKPKEVINSKWGRAVNQFSVKFLIRIHFRKYEFDVVKKLLMTSKITSTEDFYFIRNTVKQLEKMDNGDPILKYHTDKLLELRRLAQAKINIANKNKTEGVSSY